MYEAVNVRNYINSKLCSVFDFVGIIAYRG